MPTNAFLFRVIFILAGIHSLTCCSSCCGDSRCVSSELVSIDVHHLDNGGHQPVPIVSDSISAFSYAIKVNYHGSELEGLCGYFLRDIALSFSNPSKAMSCERDVFLSPDTIQKVIIHSSTDFDPTHPAGTDLSEYFIEKTISEVLPSSYNQPYWPEIREVRFLLFTAPVSESQHRFFIDVHLTNGRILSDSTEQIVLKI